MDPAIAVSVYSTVSYICYVIRLEMCVIVCPVPSYNPQQQYVPGQYGGPPQQYHQQAGMSSQGYPQPPMSMPQQQPNYMNTGNQIGLYPGYQQQPPMPDQYGGYPQPPPPQQQMRMMGPVQPGSMQMPAGGGPQMMGPPAPGQMAGMPMQPGGGQHMAPGGGMMPSGASGQGGQMRPSPAGSMSNTMPPSGQMPPGQYTNYGQQGQF